ncbi:hypothetical protein J6590_019153 [Homalodisca vitripennis]|nr:hypothetical protein J6590_019153 [Homalodisca vitripennis]
MSINQAKETNAIEGFNRARTLIQSDERMRRFNISDRLMNETHERSHPSDKREIYVRFRVSEMITQTSLT